jgi:hypothetical protein
VFNQFTTTVTKKVVGGVFVRFRAPYRFMPPQNLPRRFKNGFQSGEATKKVEA